MQAPAKTQNAEWKGPKASGFSFSPCPGLGVKTELESEVIENFQGGSVRHFLALK
jgi:hypothetical protein